MYAISSKYHDFPFYEFKETKVQTFLFTVYINNQSSNTCDKSQSHSESTVKHSNKEKIDQNVGSRQKFVCRSKLPSYLTW